MKTALLTAVAVVCALAPAGALALNGADVAQAQRALRERGHDPGAIDGALGPRTTAALRAFQEAQGLAPTGRLDDATRAKLGEPAGPAPSASPRTGGDTRPSAVDPARANTTGANVGEGASYNRSSEKPGPSVTRGAAPTK
jgi:peptidoglycan hydrolase-like protein with peptidoglycan-binding domain